MNNALTFLGIAFAIAVVGGIIVMIVHRATNPTGASGVENFQQIMDALAPEADDSDEPRS